MRRQDGARLGPPKIVDNALTEKKFVECAGHADLQLQGIMPCTAAKPLRKFQFTKICCQSINTVWSIYLITYYSQKNVENTWSKREEERPKLTKIVRNA